MLQGLMNRFGKNKARFEELETEAKMERLVGQKQKSSNERELERFHEEARQKRIKKELDFYRMQRKREVWHKNLIKQKPMFRGGKSLLHEDKHILNNGNLAFMQRGNLY